jgi:cytochrome c peroxidase
VADLRALVAPLELSPISSPPLHSAPKVALGRALFFDPELSGNRDQSCSTCHHPDHALTDGRSLSVGTAAVERDGVRMPGPDHTFVPRNSPALFNLGEPELQRLMWDGRVEEEEDGRFVFHDVGYEALGVYQVLPDGLESLLAAQIMLPVLVRDELRGEPGEVDILGQPNELALIADRDFEGVWSAVTARLLAIEEYALMFDAAYPGADVDGFTYPHVANALAAFISERFTLPDSSWDRFVQGEDAALEDAALDGALLFYGKASCADCHRGTLLTDQRFYNLAVPPMGGGPSAYEYVDYGAAHRSHVGSEARFAFRTPALHNVEHTGPWMHNGCYMDLESVIRHHVDPIASLASFDPTKLTSEFQNQVHSNPDVLAEVERYLSEEILAIPTLDDEEIAALLAFLSALSSPDIGTLAEAIPDEVPSGLPLVLP